MNTTTKPSPRPSRFSPEINAAIADALAPKVRAWLNEPDPLEDVRADLIKALGYKSDGYEIARSLEGQWYCPDAELVDILNSAHWERTKAYEKACEEWVAKEGLYGLPVGTVVLFKHAGKQFAGEIRENRTNGDSLIFCETLGHVRAGFGSHGVYINWEDIEPQPTTK